MMDHVNELPLGNQNTSDKKILTAEQQALQQLATELHRPPQSLAAFSHLSTDQLSWLKARVELICMREDARLRDELNQAIPRFLRPLLLRRLRSPS